MAKTQTKAKQNQRALHLVSTKDMSREDWLEIRKQGLGGSDAGTAIGVNPYQSQLELWMIKTGRDKGLPKIDPNDESSPTYWGTLLEPIVAQHYTKHTGNKVRRINSVLQSPHEDHPWMLANLDYTVVGNKDVQILECKTAGEWGSKLWRDGVPLYVQAQCFHMMAVTGHQAVDVCVLLCGQEIRIHRIERDEEVINRFIELERQFWHYVETDTPPPVDGSNSSATALQALFPQDKGTTIDLTGDVNACGDFNELLDVRERMQRLGEQESRLKQRIQQAMGEASVATFDKGQVSWRKSKDSTSLDSTALLKDQPELLSKYPKHREGSRRFLIRT